MAFHYGKKYLELLMNQKQNREIKRQLDEIHKEMERKCDKDYPKSRVCYVDIKRAFR